VQAAETLGHYADWSGVSSQALRNLNKLHKNALVTLGHKVKLDFSRVSPEQFAATRREYHHRLQEEFFARIRIAGTDNYSVKRGESLWVIAQQHADLPVWLVAEYNPDVDFNDVRPGTTITLPRVVSHQSPVIRESASTGSERGGRPMWHKKSCWNRLSRELRVRACGSRPGVRVF